MTHPHLSWLRALPGRPTVVAEIKRRSPYGWVNPLPWECQLAICEEIGDIISVHTSELWGGGWLHLEAVRRRTKKPILAKGFHPCEADVKCSLDCGAEKVLTVGWDGGQYRDRCWFEVETRDQLINAPKGGWIVLNARNPRTGEARTSLDLKPGKVVSSVDSMGHWICQASGIKGPEDVAEGVDAILIGQGLYT